MTYRESCLYRRYCYNLRYAKPEVIDTHDVVEHEENEWVKSGINVEHDVVVFTLTYVQNLVDQVQKFEDGLRENIRSWVTVMRIRDFSKLLKRAKLVERTLV